MQTTFLTAEENAQIVAQEKSVAGLAAMTGMDAKDVASFVAGIAPFFAAGHPLEESILLYMKKQNLMLSQVLSNWRNIADALIGGGLYDDLRAS